jgi:hypothetical protein
LGTLLIRISRANFSGTRDIYRPSGAAPGGLWCWLCEAKFTEYKSIYESEKFIPNDK